MRRIIFALVLLAALGVFAWTLRRFGRLTTRAQIEAHYFIRAYLGEAAKESSVDRQVAEQAAALEVIGQVANELGLPVGKPPTSTQFEEVSKRLGLDWSVSKVGRAWGGKWRFACQAFSAAVRSEMIAGIGLQKARA